MRKDIHDYDLSRHNTFGIHATCRRYIEFSDEADLIGILASLTEADHPLFVVGGGSNILLTADYPGTVLHSAIRGIEPMPYPTSADDILVRVGSGEVWDDFVATAVSHGWYGAENLSFIPGEIGASAVQNIGAYGVEAKDIIYKVEAVEIATGSCITIPAANIGYAYRYSRFKDEWRGRYVVTHVTYRLHRRFTPHTAYGNIAAELQRLDIATPTAAQLRDVIISIRRDKLPDPAVEGNAGSFFMNPIISRAQYESLLATWPVMPHYDVDADRVKIPAGWLIEQCGWKGKSLGKAGVHSRQALVLVNRGGATGADIIHLSDTIRADVRTRFDIDIHPEVNIL